jgi:hypothetical protein
MTAMARWARIHASRTPVELEPASRLRPGGHLNIHVALVQVPRYSVCNPPVKADSSSVQSFSTTCLLHHRKMQQTVALNTARPRKLQGDAFAVSCLFSLVFIYQPPIGQSYFWALVAKR